MTVLAGDNLAANLDPGPIGSARPTPVADRIRAAARPLRTGRIDRLGQHEADVVGLTVGPGDLVDVGEVDPVTAEVVAVAGDRATVLPYGHFRGRRIGERAVARGGELLVPTGLQLLGRILDGMGRPLDGADEPSTHGAVPVHNEAPPALARPHIDQPMPVGVRTIDTLLTCGRGQRVAILAGSGVGKSSLLSMLVRGAGADVNVLCLVGERGREVRDFIDNDLGPEGMARSVLVVATSDQPALVRRNAAYVATRIAEQFRDQGLHVNLLMDSVTRLAMAQREIGLVAGEIPAARGYPPSSLSLLAPLLERAGTAGQGSITAFYTVLIEGDDLQDPIGDTVRSIVDGHIVLSRELANAGHFPGIDVLASSSRVAPQVTSPQQREVATAVRRLLAVHERARDLIEVGAYQSGADAEIDAAIAVMPELDRFRRQDRHEVTPAAAAWSTLAGLMAPLGVGGAANDPRPAVERSPW